MSVFGTLKAGSLVLYNQTIEVADLSLGDLRFQNVDTDCTMRLRVASTTECLFEFNHVRGKEELLFQEVVVGELASSSHNNNSYLELHVASPGDKVVRQSYYYVPYSVGCNNIVVIGAVLSNFAEQPSGVRSRLGLYDDASDKTVDVWGNGFFFQLQNGSLQVGRRTSTSGTTQQDIIVDQPYFSEDPLDGTGPSAITFIPNKCYSFFIDLSWVGTGIVRMGLLKNGGLACAHVFHCEDTNFCKYASLPVRQELINVSASSTDSLKIYSGCVWAEGPLLRRPSVVCVNSGSEPVVITTPRQPVMCFRLKSSANRTSAYLKRVEVLVTKATFWEVFLGCSVTGAEWSPVGECLEMDRVSTSCTGGRLLHTFVSSDRSVSSLDRQVNGVLTADMEGESNVLVLCCSIVSTETSCDAFVCVDLEQIY